MVTSGHVTKDGGYIVRSVIAENPHTRKLHGSVFYRTGVITDVSFTLKIKIFNLFCSCDLDLDPMTFIYELDPHCLEIYQMCKYELPMSRLLKVTDWQT